jgi:transcriptional regulator with XRE-family HTH domain
MPRQVLAEKARVVFSLGGQTHPQGSAPARNLQGLAFMTAVLSTLPLPAKKPNRRADGPDPIDIHVGARLRLRRNLIGMSQEQLGRASSLTFQQIQKYERGANRMGASRLFQLARLLNVPVSYFFDELPPAMGGKNGATADGSGSALEATPQNDNQILQRRETLELIRAYYRITDMKQRRKVYDLIKSMAGVNDTAP